MSIKKLFVIFFISFTSSTLLIVCFIHHSSRRRSAIFISFIFLSLFFHKVYNSEHFVSTNSTIREKITTQQVEELKKLCVSDLKTRPTNSDTKLKLFDFKEVKMLKHVGLLFSFVRESCATNLKETGSLNSLESRSL